MATTTKQALNAANASVKIFTGGQSRVGFNLGGTWVGTASFFVSYDGANFTPLTVTPFASGTGVQTATSNGNWFADVNNALAVAVVFTTFTSGAVNVTIAAANDGSWQDAFLAPTSKFVSQSVAGGATNVITQAAQANRAQRLRSLSVGFSVAAGAAVDIKVTDGASSVLWEGYVPPSTNGISGGGTFNCPLPPISHTLPEIGGVYGTPGNSMVVTLAAPGASVVSTVNAEFTEQ